MDPIEVTNEGPVLRVRAKPNAPRDAVLGMHGDRLTVAVRAAREKGKANAAVMETLAVWLGLPKRAMHLVSGASARDKRIRVLGTTDGILRAKLEKLLKG
jgi:uncharacterized protein (TIGR00251 family)